MNRWSRYLRPPRLMVAACLAASLSTPTPLDAQAGAIGVALSATCKRARDDKSTEFHIVLRNRDDADTAVVVGIVLGNGNAYPVAMSVRSSMPTSEEKFSYSPVPPVPVGGRTDPWLVPLPSGATYSFSVPTTHFWNVQSGYLDHRERIVQIVLDSRITSTTDQRLWKVWTGELASAPMKVPDDCRSGR
jgi:hypothetical protein